MIVKETLQAPKLVVLTPVKNESWILDTFLAATSLWADHILISDQNSTDATREIVQRYPKATLIHNQCATYNESANRRNLLNEARLRFGQHNVLFSLDADEVLGPEILDRKFQEQIRALKQDSGLKFYLANISPGTDSYWISEMAPTAFVDNGLEPSFDGEIHIPRTCFREFDEIVTTNVPLIHLQYLDPVRTERKHVWYQMWEFLNSPKMGPVEIYRRYHHTAALRDIEIMPTPKKWEILYKSAGVNIFTHKKDFAFWWDDSINEWARIFGLKVFRQLDIDSYFVEVSDSRTFTDKLALKYLERTQKWYRPRLYSPVFLSIYAVDRILSLFWRRSVPKNSVKS